MLILHGFTGRLTLYGFILMIFLPLYYFKQVVTIFTKLLIFVIFFFLFISNEFASSLKIS